MNSRISTSPDRHSCPEVVDFQDPRTEALASLIREHTRLPVRRLLVVGCGSGREAAVLSRELGAETTGIDIVDDFDSAAAAKVDLRLGDATSLEFADDTFDFVYSYHAIEHIPNYRLALREMRRVLRAGGGYCIGTPNRLRLAAYFGSPGVSLADKLRWNLTDWKARLRGRFRNEFGAHAGFSAQELREDLRSVFGHSEDITLPYYLKVYRGREVMCRLLDVTGLGRNAYPCVYFVGQKLQEADVQTDRSGRAVGQGRARESAHVSSASSSGWARITAPMILAVSTLFGGRGDAAAQSLLFKSGFQSVTSLRNVTQSDCVSNSCYQYFEPYTDQSTGFTWSPSIWGGSTTRFLLLADTAINATSIRDYMFNQLMTVTGRDGNPTSALFSQITQSGCCGAAPQGWGATQIDFSIEPSSEPAGTAGDLYISYWIKFQEGMDELMEVGTVGSGWHWRSPFGWKTSGDYRITLHVRRDPYLNGGNLYWTLLGDNEANGGLPYELFWELHNMSVPVPVGEWFKFEAFWHRSLGGDGRVMIAIQRHGQARQVLFDRYGRNMASSNPADAEYGFPDSPRPINRIFLSTLYSSTPYPIYQWIDDLEIWTGIPP